MFSPPEMITSLERSDLDVAVRVHDREVAGVEPAAGEGLLGGLLVLQVALHHQVAAEHDLAHGLAVGGHRLHGHRVEHGDRLLHVVAHALAAVALGAAVDRRAFPLGVLAHTEAGP